jgi:hypothetical protein
MEVDPLHCTQALGGIHGKQWEHCCDDAPRSPRPEELSSAFGPGCERPANTHNDETDAPNGSVSVPKLRSLAENLIKTTNRGLKNVPPCSVTRLLPKEAQAVCSRSTSRPIRDGGRPTSSRVLSLSRPARRKTETGRRCGASMVAAARQIAHRTRQSLDQKAMGSITARDGCRPEVLERELR